MNRWDPQRDIRGARAKPLQKLTRREPLSLYHLDLTLICKLKESWETHRILVLAESVAEGE